MRRDNSRRRTSQTQNWWENKKILTSGIAIVAVFAAAVSISMYSGQNNKKQEKVDTNQIISLVPEEEQTNTASSTIGNSIKEEENTNQTNIQETNTVNNVETNNTADNKSTVDTTTNKTKDSNTPKTIATNTEAVKEEKKEISFTWPVQGGLLKAFSVDSLLYSATLDEWVAHKGIDIRAEQATVVTAAADGTVKSIKNDPRYGLTVVIEHSDNFKTVYSNLLTAEFITEGETVTQGQTIGTVGNTATFEIADDSHLHFEMLKDSEYVDPTLYLK